MTARDRMDLPNAGQDIRGFMVSYDEISEKTFKLVPNVIWDLLDTDSFVYLTRYIGAIQLCVLACKKVHSSDLVTMMSSSQDQNLRGPILICGGPGIRSLSDFEIAVIRNSLTLDEHGMYVKGATMKPASMKHIIGVVVDE